MEPGLAFLSTLSLRRATLNQIPPRRFHYHFYPRSPCGERRRNSQNIERRHSISIHALLAESDFDRASPLTSRTNFYPRSPCGERRIREDVSYSIIIFLSTLSLRRATAPPYNLMIHHGNFYPRSPCGERLCKTVPSGRHIIFLSTLSLRRATMFAGILTHDRRNFYPRSPCGERRVVSSTGTIGKSFLSTLSLRRATPGKNLVNGICLIISIHALLAESDHIICQRIGIRIDISIHALLAESDLKTPCVRLSIVVFLSTLSLRRATTSIAGRITSKGIFLSTLSLRRATIEEAITFYPPKFLSTLSLRRATAGIFLCLTQHKYFYPRSPCGERQNTPRRS